MKMFKKIMAVALVGVMALSMLTGCAVTNAIIEDKAEKALESAWRTHDNTDVNFKSVNFTGEKAYKDAKESVNKGNTKVKEGVAQVFAQADGDYTVVVVAEPKSAKKVDSWKNLADKVLIAAGWENGVYLNGTNSKTAKVHIETGIKGKNFEDTNKDDTYTIFVFAKTKPAYDKK